MAGWRGSELKSGLVKTPIPRSKARKTSNDVLKKSRDKFCPHCGHHLYIYAMTVIKKGETRHVPQKSFWCANSDCRLFIASEFAATLNDVRHLRVGRKAGK